MIDIKSFKKDIASGTVVFLVALPLCLGIALASGAPLISGVIAGIVGGVVVSLLSGSHVSVSGPAAGLTVVVLDTITKLGSYEKLLTAIIFSGLFQIVFAVLKLGFVADYVPTSVIQGMLVGIGLVIILKQIPHALGRHNDYEGDFSFFSGADHGNSFDELIQAITSINVGAASVTLVSLALLILWNSKFISQKLKVLPGPLLAVIAGVGINYLFYHFYPSIYLSAENGHRVTLPEDITSISGILAMLPRPDIGAFFELEVIICGAVIATIGSLETLLSLEASDKLDRKRRISSTNRELFAQGVGNAMSGCLGGIPITSVVLRTTANITSGAESRMSSFYHGLLLLISVLWLSSYINLIPLSSLAAVLLVLGYKLSSPKTFKDQWKAGFVQFFPFLITVLAVVFTDLLTGVLVGSLFGLFFVLKSTYHSAVTEVNQDKHYLIRFNKDISFLHKAELKLKLRRVPNGSFLVIDGTKANLIDHDIHDTLRDFKESAKFKNITIDFKNIRNID